MSGAMPIVESQPEKNQVEVHTDKLHYEARPVQDSTADDVDTANQGQIHVSPGVQNIEAITQAWTKTALGLFMLMIWLNYFVQGLLNSTQGALIPYVVSDFASHSLIPTVSIVATILSAITNFTIAKILDVFGRPTGFLVSLIVETLGLIMLAACQSVELYAAALVFFTVGTTGLQYTLSVFIADATSLKNRGLWQTLANSPYLITCWLGGPISTGFLSGVGFPWAFGTFAILVPVVALPVYGLLHWNYLKAKSRDLAASSSNSNNFGGRLLYYIEELDLIGIVMLSGGAALFLLPFNLYGFQPQGWDSPMIICMLVFGVVLLALFVLWERFLAPTTFMPYNMLSDRTVIGACILSATLFFSYSCWASYFTSFLQVVNDLSITNASYVLNANTVISVFAALAGGIVIRFTGRFKPVTLYIGIPLAILGMGLMIYFRQPDQSAGFLVMCVVFNALGTGIITVTDEIAVLAAVSHQQIAAAVALVSFFGGVGATIGLTVAGTIWQNTFSVKLAEYLPADQLANLDDIYGDIVTQLSFPQGSAARLAIQRAYGDAQSTQMIAATAVWALGITAAFLWRNIDVRKIAQTKGQVA